MQSDRVTDGTGLSPDPPRTPAAGRRIAVYYAWSRPAETGAPLEVIENRFPAFGLRLSPAKTRVVHMSDGFDFLGFHIRWRRKRGSNKWHVYTFIATRPIRSLKAKIRALTHRTSQQDLRYVLIRLNQIMHGWANYFRHAVAKHTFSTLDTFTWRRLISMLMRQHHWNWTAIRKRFTTPTGTWLPVTADGIEHRPIAATPVTRYRWRGTTIPNPWPATDNA
jgi:RNA-directed DNA polymerase